MAYTYDPLIDSPEAKAFNAHVKASGPLNDEVIAWLDEQLANGVTHGHLPEELRLRIVESGNKTQELYAAYMAVIGE